MKLPLRFFFHALSYLLPLGFRLVNIFTIIVCSETSRALSSQTLCVSPFRVGNPSIMSIRRCVYSYTYRF